MSNRLTKALLSALWAFKESFFYQKPVSPYGLNEKMVWNNRPSFSMRGVAQYDVISGARIHQSKGSFPDLISDLAQIFIKESIATLVSLTDINGVASAGLKNTNDFVDCVDFSHFIETECEYYAKNISMEALNALLPQLKFNENKASFEIYGWCNQLFHNAGNSHRICSAAHIARQLGHNEYFNDRIDLIRISKLGLEQFARKYQAFLVSPDQSFEVEQYILHNNLDFVELRYPEYFPCNSSIYILRNQDLPADFYIDSKANKLNQFYTDFIKVLSGQFHMQENNPILNKYLKQIGSL